MHFPEGDYYCTKVLWPTTAFITLVTYKNKIYDIGTNILNLQCFNFPQNPLFCKSIFVRRICNIVCALSDGSIKTWFKAICDVFSKICMRPWIRSFTFLRPKRPLRVDLRPNFIFCLPKMPLRVDLGVDFINLSAKKAPAGRLGADIYNLFELVDKVVRVFEKGFGNLL